MDDITFGFRTGLGSDDEDHQHFAEDPEPVPTVNPAIFLFAPLPPPFPQYGDSPIQQRAAEPASEAQPAPLPPPVPRQLDNPGQQRVLVPPAAVQQVAAGRAATGLGRGGGGGSRKKAQPARPKPVAPNYGRGHASGSQGGAGPAPNGKNKAVKPTRSCVRCAGKKVHCSFVPLDANECIACFNLGVTCVRR